MNIRRYYISDALVFITQIVQDRTPVFQELQYLALLRTTLQRVKDYHPFTMLAYVFLPDHFHLLIQPTSPSNFSDIMHSLKRNFTIAYKAATGTVGQTVFWQKGFWDHIIRDEIDLQRHLDYIHYNPVKHGLVDRPESWPHSSFVHWQKRGAYPEQWGWSAPTSIADYNWQKSE
ncbi:MAG: transposase [Chloroflexi bacterium]|nr:transposase [Chloroflexota bacterium]